MDTVNTVRDLRARAVKIRSLAQSEATWVTYLDAEPDTAEAVIGDILTTLYEITSSGQDSHGADVVIITCRSCGYYEEHFAQRGLAKAGRKCDRCGR